VFYCSSSRYFRYKDYNYNPDGQPPNTPFPQNYQPPGGSAGSGVRVPYLYNTICRRPPGGTSNTEIKFKKIYEFNAANSLVLVDVLEGGVAHINGWNVARGDMSIDFVIDKTIVEYMKSAECQNLTNNAFTCWDKIMDKFLQR
jgi:hypothetical protein